MKAIKTITYLTAKLDRNPGRNYSTTEIVLSKLKGALIHIGKVVLSMFENGHKQLIRIEGERMKRIVEANRRKRSKVMYQNWGHNPDLNTQKFINQIRFGK